VIGDHLLIGQLHGRRSGRELGDSLIGFFGGFFIERKSWPHIIRFRREAFFSKNSVSTIPTTNFTVSFESISFSLIFEVFV